MPPQRTIEIEDVIEPVLRKNSMSLADHDPDIAAEWCYKKNEGWGPERFSYGSGIRVWWECPFCLRKYKAKINMRTANNSACPYCASKKVCTDNALTVFNPSVAAEWHPRKNGKVKVTDVTRASCKKAWWLCSSCKHEWQATPADRTVSESGCPACYEARMDYAREHPPKRKRGHVVLGVKNKPISRDWYEAGRIGFVPLSKSHKKIAKQWHYGRNGTWTPDDFAKGSEAMVWWKCPKGKDHEWQSPIYSRTGEGRGRCPFCIGKRVSKTNSLKELFPKVAKQWHPKLNGKLTPEDVTAHSGKKVWWQCAKASDHVWNTTVGLRTAGRQCPFCSKVRASKDNNLKAVFPYIAAQLHPTKNGELKPEQIAPSSSKRVWWMCKKGPDHVWLATPANRTGRGSGCPCCTGKQASVTNSLASLFPKVAKEWHKAKNGKLRASEVTAHSKKKVWWQCKNGHECEQIVGKRVLRKGGCLRCKLS